MGKKFGENTKSAVAKGKKQVVENEKKEKLEKEKEKKVAEEWSVGAKDQSKKQIEEQKRLEKLSKKAELKTLEEQEAKEVAQIKTVKARGSEKKIAAKELKLNEATENVSVEAFHARNIDDAIDLLSITNSSKVSAQEGIERHPERRVKAAYSAYEERELPIFKKENPSLRHTQLKELIWKEWQKSPENPMNQRYIDYNLKPEEEKRMLEEDRDARLESYRLTDPE